MAPYLVYIFREALRSEYRQRAVAFLSQSRGEARFCHVDLCVVLEDGELPPKVFSAYMNQPLRCVAADVCGYSNRTDAALAMSVTEDEARVAREYLDGLVQRQIPYNQKDLAMCLLPQRLQGTVADVAPDAVQTVFCSQLGVLLLRKALSSNNNATSARVISRCTSPNALYALLSPSWQRVRPEALVMGRVSGFMQEASRSETPRQTMQTAESCSP